MCACGTQGDRGPVVAGRRPARAGEPMVRARPYATRRQTETEPREADRGLRLSRLDRGAALTPRAAALTHKGAVGACWRARVWPCR